MIVKYIEQIIAPALHKYMIWVQDSLWRIIYSLGSLLIVLAFGIMFYKWLEFKNLYDILLVVINYLNIISLHNMNRMIWVAYLILLLFVVFIVDERRKSKIIEVKLNKWNRITDYFIVPQGPDWSMIDDDDSFGKVISVTNSGATGHLKKGMEWCNYKLSFKAKIITSNFTFAIRVRDKNNCLFFQCAGKNICPHIIVEGIAITSFNNLSLPFEIPSNKWVKVGVSVKNNEVIIDINGMQKEFRIPASPWFIKKDDLRAVLEYSNVEKATKEVYKTIDTKNEIAQDLSLEEIVKSISTNLIDFKLKEYHQFAFDYDRGSIGFRESASEHALFKDITVELLDKI